MDKILAGVGNFVCAVSLVGFVLILSPQGVAQECEPNPSELDNGCAGCTTLIIFMCDTVGGECDGCEWQVTATISCGPTIQTTVGGADVECGGKYERRFGGCGSGPAWGSIVCKCEECPE